MTHLPTTSQLEHLTHDITRDGVGAHADLLNRIADVTAQARLFPGTVQVLRDPNATVTQTSRALVKLRSHWTRIVATAQDWEHFATSYRALASHWEQHQHLRATHDVVALAESGACLRTLRHEAIEAAAKV